MKKAFAMIFCAVLLAVSLVGCGYSVNIGDFTITGSGQLFEVNDHGEQDLSGVSNIEISSVSDTITVTATGEKVTADLKGSCRSSTQPVWLDMRKAGSTVYIEVKYPSVSISCNTALGVTIPASYNGDLSVKTVSGNIEAEGLPYKLQDVSLGTVSGGINFSAESMASLNVSSVSGNADVSGIAGDTKANSISGGINLDFNSIAAVTATTVSGNVEMKIPKDAAFKVEFGSISGSFHSGNTGLDVSNSGRGFSASTGDGGPLLKVHTTSGDFRIEGK
jgi:hypothetical protein